jgi:hypothetical protein
MQQSGSAGFAATPLLDCQVKSMKFGRISRHREDEADPADPGLP